MSNKDNFTDIHCHILPRLDDGAEKVEESEKMLRTAYKENVIIQFHYTTEKSFFAARELRIC